MVIHNHFWPGFVAHILAAVSPVVEKIKFNTQKANKRSIDFHIVFRQVNYFTVNITPIIVTINKRTFLAILPKSVCSLKTKGKYLLNIIA